ncbi:unnamed protein product [Rotaria socialis]|uniref:Uncharacterized protein n=1 Tax=Rotaria socialis TaxID=392032 RepID=A0A817QWT6_9BILA|nr:unnamed protein product [Rotaria socialis]
MWPQGIHANCFSSVRHIKHGLDGVDWFRSSIIPVCSVVFVSVFVLIVADFDMDSTKSLEDSDSFVDDSDDVVISVTVVRAVLGTGAVYSRI